MQHRTARRQFSLTSRRTAACVAVAALGGIAGVTAAAAADEPTTTVPPATTTTAPPGASTSTIPPATTTTRPAPPTTMPSCSDRATWTQVDPSGAPAQVVGPDGTQELCVIEVPAPADPIDGPPNTTG